MSKKLKNTAQKPETTGHVWDGVEEYLNPDPFWLRLFFYGALFFALVYWLLYPSWPTPGSQGLLGWNATKELNEARAEIEVRRSEYQQEFDAASFEEIMKSEKLMKFAVVGGQSTFADNCAPCHGVGGGGNLGYPNLTDNDWLWGGAIDDIYTTLKYGVRSIHEETRESQMAAFGLDKILTQEQIAELTHYVLALNEGVNSESTSQLFLENCASCHGKNGEGNQLFGAPNLKDPIWLYGNSYEQVYNSIFRGRSGVMPAWIDKLSDSTIRQLTIYVYQLGGGQSSNDKIN